MSRVVKESSRRSTRATSKPTRGLLVVAACGELPESLVHAIEREFPHIRVEGVSSLADACKPIENEVDLILVDMKFLREIDNSARDLLSYHPNAHIVLMHDDDRMPIHLQEILSSPFARGVLPMNLKLDVWLSVINLLLHGGEYFPAKMLQPIVQHGLSLNNGRAAIDQPELDPSVVAKLRQLTPREQEILELVARGLPNKLIASELSLSEHTVKIHLHNIIAKLSVHNRTEAAGMYRDLQNAAPTVKENLPRPSGSSSGPS